MSRSRSLYSMVLFYLITAMARCLSYRSTAEPCNQLKIDPPETAVPKSLNSAKTRMPWYRFRQDCRVRLPVRQTLCPACRHKPRFADTLAVAVSGSDTVGEFIRPAGTPTRKRWRPSSTSRMRVPQDCWCRERMGNSQFANSIRTRLLKKSVSQQMCKRSGGATFPWIG